VIDIDPSLNWTPASAGVVKGAAIHPVPAPPPPLAARNRHVGAATARGGFAPAALG